MKIEDCQKLFAKTGNQCAYPGCAEPLIDKDDDYLGHMCHIEAAKKGGARYNPEMTEEERSSVNNLIVLCRNHHAVVDKKEHLYTVAHLQKMKADHEKNFTGREYQLSELAIQQIFKEQLKLQHDVNQSNLRWRECFELAMELEYSDDPSEHFDEISKIVSKMELWMDEISEYLADLPNEIETFFSGLGYDLEMYRAVSYRENPFISKFWETINLAIPNHLNFIEFHLKALEAHINLQKLKENPIDTSLQRKADKLNAELIELASTLTHAD